MPFDKAFFFCLFVLCSLCCACGQREATSDLPVTKQNAAAKAVIQQRLFYNDIPSASGVEVHNGHYYVIGDDSPFLYVLDKEFQLVQQHAIADTAGFGNGRVRKDLKKDLESMTKVVLDGKTYLLLLGSGASAARQQGYLVSLQEPLSPVVQPWSLREIYQRLQQDSSIFNNELLNIEGAANGNGKLYLLQRALGKGKNALITFDLSEFITFLTGPATAAPPSYAVSFFSLPQLDGYTAGFSGAYLFDDKLFFTASVENTADAIADGEVLGSFIGFIPAAAMEAAADAFSMPVTVPATLITQADGSVFLGKAESLVVVERLAADKKYKVIVVTDDDKGHSELLVLTIRLGE